MPPSNYQRSDWHTGMLLMMKWRPTKSEACAACHHPDKSRDKAWILSVHLISAVGKQRRWRIRTLTSTFPQAPRGPVYIGGAWGGGFDLDEYFHYWFLEQSGQRSDKDLTAGQAEVSASARCFWGAIHQSPCTWGPGMWAQGWVKNSFVLSC